MKNFLQPGHVINFTPTVAVLSGQVVAVGALLAVSQNAVAADTPGTAQVCGVFTVPKVAGNAIGKGEPVLWDASAAAFDAASATPATGDITGAGAVAWEAAVAGDITMKVKLTGVPGTVHA